MRLTRFALALVAFAAAACKDGPAEPPRPGPPAALVVTGGAQAARAGTSVTTPITIRVNDANGRGVPGQTVSFTVELGGGSLAAASAVTNAEGIATMPAWTIGKSAVPQSVRATVGSLSSDITATVQTSYLIDVRFFGAAMSAEHQALFTNAAARLSAVVIGDVTNVNATNPTDLATTCGIAGLPTLAEIVDDVIIYAAVQDIDGPGKILAQAGPCLVRQAQFGRQPVVGIMSFDIADLQNLSNGGRLQDVITHEMLHVLGIGTMWSDRGLIADAGLETVNYSGTQARSGCVDVGGSAACAANVPLENTGGPGTRDGHWRESVFDSELMTGFAEQREMPLSFLTIGALADLGYTVNRDAKDNYSVPVPAAIAAKVAAESKEAWERELPTGVAEISPNGRTTILRRPGTNRTP
jgi:hypothetical protein